MDMSTIGIGIMIFVKDFIFVWRCYYRFIEWPLFIAWRL